MNLFSNIKNISQMPIILIPCSFGNKGLSIVIRPVITNDFMTAIPAEIGKYFTIELLNEVQKEIKDYVDNLFIDVTSKPPGTIEWE
jgi:GMP synthase PP-ATPase subunit